MRLATRTFLWSLLPFALLLAGSFWAAQTLVLSQVRDELRSAAEDTQSSIVRMGARSEMKSAQVLKIVAENAALKDGLQLLLSQRGSREARRTVEDQLQEISANLGFDFLLISDADNQPLAAVMGAAGRLTPIDVTKVRLPQQGYVTVGAKTYQAASVPVNQGPENLGILSVGEQVDLSGVPLSAVLVHDGAIVASNGQADREIESALRPCKPGAECDLHIQGEAFLSLPMGASNNGYELRSLQSVDAATRGFQSTLRGFFAVTGFAALAGLVFISGLSARSIVQPILGVIEHLRESGKTGLLPEFHGPGQNGPGLNRSDERIYEIRELTRAFNRAAAANREAHGKLQRANVEFIESLANALDARDPYTAGHSRRVSQYSVAIAESMALEPGEIETIRIGALLHDIGKIGVSDTILQKPGKLTPEENAVIQQHPTIGRRILEGVNGFQPYLPVIELHHENWDGTGYPHGLRAEQAPLAARIVKIADAYDAMTSDRPYRQGMQHEQALAVFETISGTQLDPKMVAVFRGIQPADLSGPAQSETESLRRLAAAVRSAAAPAIAPSPVEHP